MSASALEPVVLTRAGALAVAALIGAAGFDTPGAAPPAGTDPPPARDELAVELNRRLTQDVAPLLATYCFACHRGDDAPAGLRLDGLTGLDDLLSGDFDARLIR